MPAPMTGQPSAADAHDAALQPLTLTGASAPGCDSANGAADDP